MTSEKKPMRIAGIAILAVLLTIITIIGIALFSHGENGDTQQVSLYFFNAATKRLEPEYRNIPVNEELGVTIEAVIYELLQGPTSATHTGTIPLAAMDSGEGLRFANQINAISRPNQEGRIVEITFSKEYNDLSVNEELILRSSLVYTLTDIEGVDSVRILVQSEDGLVSGLTRLNGNTVDSMNKENLVINPAITPEKINTQSVRLYFAAEDYAGLSSEMRVVEVVSQTPERIVVDSIIAGPVTSGLVGLIPSDAQVSDVFTLDRICYVEVTSSFLSKLPTALEERTLAIYSIVNSLVDLPEGNFNKVQFLLDGERIDADTGGIDMSQPFEENKDLILSSAYFGEDY